MTSKRNHEQLGSWLDRFGRAWETRDPEQAAQLFGDDASYQEAPFDEPLTGASGIRVHWANLPSAREDIRFTYEILAVTQPWGIAHWHGFYTQADRETHIELDGILLISLDDEGRCQAFREWSNRRER